MNNETSPPALPSSPNPEHVIVHAAYPLWRKHALIAIARAKELQDQGQDVVLTYCDSRNGTCAVNFAGNPMVCQLCRHRIKKSAEDAGLKVYPLRTPNRKKDEPAQEPAWQQKKDIVEGVQSAITSTFRQLPADSNHNPVIRTIKRRYYQTSMQLLEAMNQRIAQQKPDRIEVFNGRQACSRFCLAASRQHGIPFNTLEVTSTGKPIVFHGHTAHDRAKIQQRMLSHPADYEVAEQYYARRRKPSINKYAKKHASEFAPPSDEGFRKKISVFLSSQDEFESLGKEWRSPFQDYAGVLKQTCERNSDYLFCIRFHPNQADMASDITTPFQSIQALGNTVVYYPQDTVNTYALMEWSDVVVTFGSTVTVEACWMGKPAVMLGPSFFDQLDVSYTPQSTEAFLQLIRQDLSAKNADNAARVAGFEEHDYDPMKYLDASGKITPNGIHVVRPWLSQIARTSDNLFCRAIKLYARLRTQKKDAQQSLPLEQPAIRRAA